MVGAIIGGVASLAGGVASLLQARKAKRKLEQEQKNERIQAQAEINRDYLQTDAAKSTLNALRQQNERLQKKQNTSAVRGGLTDEARVGMAQQQNQATADTVSRLAGIGTAYQQNARINYSNILNRQAQQNYDNDMNVAQAIGQSINGLGAAAGGISDAFAGGGIGQTKVNASSVKSPEATTSVNNNQQVSFINPLSANAGQKAVASWNKPEYWRKPGYNYSVANLFGRI